MERNLERQTLSFSKGMTNVPSDLLSDDSELLESDGFIFKDGEMKAVQKGVSIGNVPYKIMYVHKMADYENIIAYDGTENIYWYTKDDSGNIASPPDGVTKSFNVGTVYDVNSIGNTLVCATSEGIHYLLYKGNKYKDLGKELPRLDYDFTFERPTGNYTQEESGRTLCNAENAIETKQGESYFNPLNHTFIQAGGVKPDGSETKSYIMFSIKVSSDSKYENEFQETIQGHVAQAISWAKSKNMFAFPFFLRCAFRMFDGSYCRITTPIVCYPTVNKNCMFSSAVFDSTHNTYMDLHQMGGAGSMFYFIEYRELLFRFESISSDWSDIIKEIVVFASDQVVPFYIDKGWHFESPNGLHKKYAYANFGYKTYEEKLLNYDVDGSTSTDTTKEPYTRTVHDELLPKYKSDQQIISELLSKTVFYKLFTVPIAEGYLGGNKFHYTVTGQGGETAFIADGTLENLQEQEQLKVDDYYGWASLSAESIYNYNGRLNLIGTTRTPFAGFAKFVGKDRSKDDGFLMFTHIVSDKCDTWTERSVTADEDFLQGWLFYPDPNATEVIFHSGGKYIRINLKAHPRLNGAYTFPVLPPNKPQEFAEISESELLKIVTSVNDKEDLNSQIFTSVVNNPFVFEASGDNTVGTGKILGIIANTEAVSQGQFGQYPLMAFTDEGIYGLSVNSEGLYSRAYPISREVCNEDSPLVPTDRLVFFAAKKGLMAASGGSVACMSEQMRGRVPRNFATFGEGKFLDFLKDCFIAYDYRDSILRIFSKGKSYQYIFNMVDKTFSMVNSGIEAQAVVNDYPDNLIQDTNGNVYSLTAKPDTNEDTESYSGSFTTRPLKLGGSMTLKSLRAVKHLFDSDEGTIGLEIYGSNDCKHWCKLPSLAGKPWKYFTFKYTLQNFKAADSFAGSIVEVQSRREDKMR
jgi:hypothetical protein